MENSLLLIVPKRRGLPCYTGPHGEALGSVRRNKGKTFIGAFLIVGIGRNGWGRVSCLHRFRIK